MLPDEGMQEDQDDANHDERASHVVQALYAVHVLRPRYDGVFLLHLSARREWTLPYFGAFDCVLELREFWVVIGDAF